MTIYYNTEVNLDKPRIAIIYNIIIMWLLKVFYNWKKYKYYIVNWSNTICEQYIKYLPNHRLVVLLNNDGYFYVCFKDILEINENEMTCGHSNITLFCLI